MLSTFLKPFSDLIRRKLGAFDFILRDGQVFEILYLCHLQDNLYQTFVGEGAVENAMDCDDIAILKVVTEIQGHGEGELVAGAFINKPIRSGMVVLIDVGVFEVDASKTHDLLVHLTGGQVIAKDADNL